jgi:hypothetical protein
MVVNTTKRVLKTRLFARWMSKTELTDALLLRAVAEMEQGLVGVELGGNLFKKRLGFPNKGKRGSARTIIAVNHEAHWFFIFGFEKNVKSTISKQELDFLKEYARMLLQLDDSAIDLMIAEKKLAEIFIHEKA